MKCKLKIILSLVISSVLVLCLFTGCSKTPDTKTFTKVRLNEVVRSVFYAPMYAAINEGFFEEEGIEIELSTGQGADKTMQQVLSGSCDIGFCGPEQIIYIYNQKRADYPILFAQLTATDGSFLVSRENEPSFNWESLKGKTIIGGRPGGVPEMTLEYVLRNHGLDPQKDVELITNLAFTATAGAFKAGTGDYVALFEPTASLLEKDNAGHIVASIGKTAGTIPYTCYFSTKSYMENHKEILEKFTRAIYKGQMWVDKHSDAEVAESIKSFFPGSDSNILEKVVNNYREINAFAHKPNMNEEDLSRLMDIIQSYKADLIPERPPFNIIVNNDFANKIILEFENK